jgi:choline dehydrogenase-like flavoprotein
MYDFVVIGSGWGGATLTWMLGKSSKRILVLEQGEETSPTSLPGIDSNRAVHDKDHNTYREFSNETALSFSGGWTASGAGGGSRLWGGWSLPPTRLDWNTRSFFQDIGQIKGLEGMGYNLSDWPLPYDDFLKYVRLAESLLCLSGDRTLLQSAFESASWHKNFSPCIQEKYLTHNSRVLSSYDRENIRLSPIATDLKRILEQVSVGSAPLPLALNRHQNQADFYQAVVEVLRSTGLDSLETWARLKEHIPNTPVSVKDAFCAACDGLYLPKHHEARIRAKAHFLNSFEAGGGAVDFMYNTQATRIAYDKHSGLAQGVYYISGIDQAEKFIKARSIVLAAGAVQTARLLLLSKDTKNEHGLGNSSGAVGKNATFHIFGLWLKAKYSIAPKDFEKSSCLGPSGNLVSYEYYLSQDTDSKNWLKGGVTIGQEPELAGVHARSLQVSTISCPFTSSRLNEGYGSQAKQYLLVFGDDLPHKENYVDIDASHKDRNGVPVARITRSFGPYEIAYRENVIKSLVPIFERHKNTFSIETSLGRTSHFGDHQMGTCRMGEDKRVSVTDTLGRLHDVPNVFVCDTSVFPTGMGVNPTLTVVANALRVGTEILEQRLG